MSWASNLLAIVSRFREPDTLTGEIPGELDTPYFDQDEVEDHMLIVCNDLLREVPAEELQAIGSPAVALLSGSVAYGAFRSVTMPLTAIGALSVTINNQPAVEASAVGFFQLVKVDSQLDSAYTFADGRCLFYGTVSDIIRIECLSECDIATWQAQSILPPGYDLEIIDRVVSRLLIIDYLKPQTMYGGVNNGLV